MEVSTIIAPSETVETPRSAAARDLATGTDPVVVASVDEGADALLLAPVDADFHRALNLFLRASNAT